MEVLKKTSKKSKTNARLSFKKFFFKKIRNFQFFEKTNDRLSFKKIRNFQIFEKWVRRHWEFKWHQSGMDIKNVYHTNLEKRYLIRERINTLEPFRSVHRIKVSISYVSRSKIKNFEILYENKLSSLHTPEKCHISG